MQGNARNVMDGVVGTNSGMTQADLVKRAQTGDAEAIASFLNRNLQPRGVTAKVLLRERCLKILLSSTRPLAQSAFVRFVQQQITGLDIADVTLVKVYGQQVGEALPAWSQEFAPLESKLHSAIIPMPIASLAVRPSSRGSAIAPVTALVPSHAEAQPKSFWAVLRSFHLDSILPLQEVLNSGAYQNHYVKLLLFLGLFPLLISLVARQASVAQIAWILGIYYASIWGVILYNLIQPPQFSWGNTIKCMVFTTFVGIPVLLTFQRVPPFNSLYQATTGGWLVARLLGFVFGVGLLEELCKVLPIYLILLRPGKIRDPHTAAFYGATSGLGFAIAEGAAYSILYAFGVEKGQIGLGSFVAANTIRFVSLPLFHAILAGISGYFMGLAAINPARQGAIMLIGVAIAATLHGSYNAFAGTLPSVLIIGFSILLFVTYLRRSQQMVTEMEQAEREHQSSGQRD